MKQKPYIKQHEINLHLFLIFYHQIKPDFRESWTVTDIQMYGQTDKVSYTVDAY